VTREDRRSFTDEAVLFVRAGRGGDGAATFRREPYTPRGGPDGGDGGPGGSVVLQVSSGLADLSFLADHPHQRAENGAPGARGRRSGAGGRDLVLDVPDGTLVSDERGPVADLVGRGARVVVAHGGRGGRGNASLGGPRNRAPRHAEAGEPGEERRVELELRTVADVGLVGLPNAGKSTLLSRLSAARPKVADYPFTTLAPNLGVSLGEERIVIADVPGVIEGAHTGRGLGHRFLRHVMRCRALVVVVDLSAAEPAADLGTVRAELAAFDPALANRPWIVAGTKVDLLDPDPRRDVLEAMSRHAEVLPVSGLTGEGIEPLERRMLELSRSAPSTERKPFVVLRPGRERFLSRREGERFRVVGRDVERWVAGTDFDDEQAVAALQRRLRRGGVERRLADEGARRGDEVVIGDRPFEFLPDEGPADGG
jgi:GTP-binding protein